MCQMIYIWYTYLYILIVGKLKEIKIEEVLTHYVSVFLGSRKKDFLPNNNKCHHIYRYLTKQNACRYALPLHDMNDETITYVIVPWCGTTWHKTFKQRGEFFTSWKYNPSFSRAWKQNPTKNYTRNGHKNAPGKFNLLPNPNSNFPDGKN